MKDTMSDLKSDKPVEQEPALTEQVREARLLERARNGDMQAAEELFRLHRPRLHRLFAYAAPRQEVDDLLQETMAAGATNITKFRGRSSLFAWLTGIARNVLRNHFRSGARGGKTISLEDLESEAGVQRDTHSVPLEQRVVMDSTTSLLYTAITNACTAQEQHVLTLYYQGEPLNDIGELLQMPAATVRSHYRRGRCKLLSHLIRVHTDLLGGQEAIRTAWEKACRHASPSERPSAEEQTAWTTQRPGARGYCGAVLKLARYLNLAA